MTKRYIGLVSRAAALIIIQFLILKTEAIAADATIPPVPPLTSQSGWTKNATPVIKAGDMQTLAFWNDPDIHKTTSGTPGLIMYLTANSGAPFSSPVLPYRAVSTDGMTGMQWKLSPATPLLTLAGTKFTAIETPNVVQFNNQYHMYFTAEYAYPPAAPGDFSIGHATSPDGIKWTVDPQPVIKASGNASDWNGFLVAEPGAVVFKNQIYLYFGATGARASGQPPQLQTIGLAKSTDGVHFTAAKQVLGQSALYPPSVGYAGYSTPAPFILNNKVHLVYDVALNRTDADPNWQQVALHHASSIDGETNFVQDTQPIMTRTDLNFTRGEIIGPTLLVDGNNLRLWFGGHIPNAELANVIRNNYVGVGNSFGIGYATHTLCDQYLNHTSTGTVVSLSCLWQ